MSNEIRYDFNHVFELAEKYGRGYVNRKEINGKLYILLNDNLSKLQSEYYASKLRSIRYSARVFPQKNKRYKKIYGILL